MVSTQVLMKLKCKWKIHRHGSRVLNPQQPRIWSLHAVLQSDLKMYRYVSRAHAEALCCQPKPKISDISHHRNSLPELPSKFEAISMRSISAETPNT